MSNLGPAREKFPAFPFAPYDIQVGFMQKLYHVLENGEVGFFESPTGTGKTMSLICGSLHWLLDYKARPPVTSCKPTGEQTSTVRCDSDQSDPDWLVRGGALPPSPPLKERRPAAQKKRPQVASKTPDMEFLLNDEECRPESDEDGNEEAADVHMDVLAAEVPRTDPQIIFCSRTHSQLSQFVGELHKTSFADLVSLVPVASRKSLCINEEVRQLVSLSRINERCLELQSSSRKVQAAAAAGVPPGGAEPTSAAS